jgi:hypothetical protein
MSKEDAMEPLKLPPLTFDPFDHAEADGTTAAWLAAF